MAITLTINPSGSGDFIGASTTNSVAVDAVLRGLPSEDIWVIFDPADKIATADRIFVPVGDISSGEVFIPIQIEPLEGQHIISAVVTDADNNLLGSVQDDIELDLPDFTLSINSGAATTTSTFVTLTIDNIPPGEMLWVVTKSTQVNADRAICFSGAQTATGSITFPVQLAGAQGGTRIVELVLYQDSPYVFWGQASDTIELALPPFLPASLIINPLAGFPSGEAYTNSTDAYVRIGSIPVGEPLSVTLSGDMEVTPDPIDFTGAETTPGFVDIDIDMSLGANAGDGYEDGYRTIYALLTNLEQQSQTISDEIVLDTTPPSISYVSDAYGGIIAGIPGFIDLFTNEPAQIFYSIDGYSATTESYTESIDISVPQGADTLILSAIAVDFAGNVSEEFVQEFALDIIGARTKRFGKEGTGAEIDNIQIFSHTDRFGDSEEVDAYRLGRPQDDFIQETPRVRVIDPAATKTLRDDPVQITLNVNESMGEHLNRNAKVFEIDTRLPMPTPIILRNYMSLRQHNKGGFVDANLRELDPYISGSYVRSLNNMEDGVRHSMYYDNNSGQWIRNTTTFDPPERPLQVFDGYTGRSRFVFQWVPYKGSRII